MSDTVKLIIEIPKKVFEARKTGEISPCVTVPILDAVQNGIPLDNDSDRAEAQAYFDGQAYGWEQGRKALIDDVKAEIEKKCDRINSIASVLRYPQHREIQELLCEILASIDKESEGV